MKKMPRTSCGKSVKEVPARFRQKAYGLWEKCGVQTFLDGVTQDSAEALALRVSDWIALWQYA